MAGSTDSVWEVADDLLAAPHVVGGRTWERILRTAQADADAAGRIDWSMVKVDSRYLTRPSARGWCPEPAASGRRQTDPTRPAPRG